MVEDQTAACPWPWPETKEDALRDPWPSFPWATTEAWPMILLGRPTTQPIKWSGWYGVPRV